jgi:protein-glutamine gamma-glutamyltransferase
MIKIGQMILKQQEDFTGVFSPTERMILNHLLKNEKVYEFPNMLHLKFELFGRQQIIQAAKDLAHSQARFTTFEYSRCNEKFWSRTPNGGFLLKENHKPSIAIEDIFLNSHLYAFECATAIVIIFYKAVLHLIEKKHFDHLFANVYLYDWHYDQDLSIKTRYGTDYIPGDCLYFDNPDVDPKTPHWQGENAIYLGEDMYFGHGIGIRSKQEMIRVLNRLRKPGATKSAYLLEQTTRIQFSSLFPLAHPSLHRFIVAAVGNNLFLYE